MASQGVIEDNYFVGAPLGFNVKIGGTALRPDEGSDGVTLQRNTMVTNRVDGSNLLISTNSDHVHVSQNVLAAQGQGEPVMNVGLGYFDGADLQFNSNIVWGYDPALYGGARPILWHDYYGSFDSIVNVRQH